MNDEDAGDRRERLKRIRTSNMSEEEIMELQEEMQDDERDIDLPEKSEIFDKSITVPEEVSQNVYLNGHSVHPIYAKLNNMMHSGYSPIVCIVGKEGKGKSMTANVLLWYMHDKLNILRGSFDAETQVVYRPLEFLMLLRETTRTGIMFDEANETVNKNDYNSDMNSAVIGALRTQRKRENLYVFVGPELSEFDPRIREKVDVVIEMKGKQFAKVKTYKLKHGKRDRSGMNYSWTQYPNWVVPDLPKSKIKDYEKVDNKYKGEYLDELLGKVLSNRLDQVQDDKTMSL